MRMQNRSLGKRDATAFHVCAGGARATGKYMVRELGIRGLREEMYRMEINEDGFDLLCGLILSNRCRSTRCKVRSTWSASYKLRAS